MEEWKEYKLGDCVEAVIDNRGKSAPTKPLGEFPLLEINSIGGYYPNYSVIRKYVDEVTYNTWFRSGHPICGDILIPTVGTIGIISIMDNHKACIAQNLIALRTKKEISNIFIYYFLKSPIVKKQLINLDIGGVQPSIKVPHLLNLSISLPEKDIQHKIASILSSLDDKIESNRRINENLEQQAQALFKSWFVDFEPFKDQPFVESELGMIPQGWKVESLSLIADYINGLAMQKFRPDDGEKGLPVLKIKELGQGNVDENSELCSPSLIGEKYIINDGDIIFSWSGTLMVKIWCGGKCGLNQHLFVVNPKDYPKWFVYQWTKYHLDNFIRIAKDKAVTMGHIKRSELDKAKTVIPDKENMQRIDALMKPIFEQIIANELESRRLAELRDTLLPRLMSGELKVNDVDA